MITRSCDSRLSNCVFDLCIKALFNDLIAIKPMNKIVDTFNYYCLELYVDQDALFPISIWAEFITITNICKSFHAK